jgi:prepilin-type N-terminal cleavage/methylation domain-containing protein
VSGLQRALERRWRLAARRVPAASERGFTIIELVIVLVILSVVFAMVTSLLVSFNQQATNIQDSVAGVRQETSAGQTLIQYLRGASQLLPVYNKSGTQVGPSPTELDAVTSEGFSTSTYTSSCTNLDALWFIPSGGAHPDAQFDVTFDVSAAGPANGAPNPPAPWSLVTPASNVPTAFTPASTCTPVSLTPRMVAAYFALSSQTSRVFTYYSYVGTALTPLPIQTPVVPACAINEIAAVGIHVTFLAGPQVPTEGYAAIQPTTLDTIVYLRGSSTTATTTTTTTSTLVTCPE